MSKKRDNKEGINKKISGEIKELTFRRYVWSGWCFVGMNMMRILSKSWTPLRAEIPMYRKTPKSTGRGIFERTGVRKTDGPMKTDIIM